MRNAKGLLNSGEQEAYYLLNPYEGDPDDDEAPDWTPEDLPDYIDVPRRFPNGERIGHEDRMTLAFDAIEAAKLSIPEMSHDVVARAGDPNSKADQKKKKEVEKYIGRSGDSPEWLAQAALQDAYASRDGKYGGRTPKIRLIGMSINDACKFIAKHHSALPKCNRKGIMYAIGAMRNDRLVAVATAGTPTGRWKNPHSVLELTRVASDGTTMNAASQLVSRLLKITKGSVRGVDGAPARFVTYQLATERGSTYRALRELGLRPVAFLKGTKKMAGARAGANDSALAKLDKVRWEAGPGAAKEDKTVLDKLTNKTTVHAGLHFGGMFIGESLGDLDNFHATCDRLDEAQNLLEGRFRRLVLPPQLFLGSQPDMSKMKKVVNRQPRGVKPDSGGLWTSTYHPGKRGSDWKEFSAEMGRGVNAGWILQPKSAIVYVVNTLEDLEYLYDNFNRPSSLPPELAIAMGEEKLLDFEAMSKMFDAIHLSKKGQVATRMTTPNLYGWDIESTLWFNWKFGRNPSLLGLM